MANRKKLSLTFFSSLTVGVLSLLFFIFCIFSGISLAHVEIVYAFLLVAISLSFLLTFVSLGRILADIKYETNETQELERTVKDIYRYDQFLDPPDMDN